MSDTWWSIMWSVAWLTLGVGTIWAMVFVGDSLLFRAACAVVSLVSYVLLMLELMSFRKKKTKIDGIVNPIEVNSVLEQSNK